MRDKDNSQPFCKVSFKRCYTAREAGKIINSYKNRGAGKRKVNLKKVPKRKYFCKDCGYYHLTSGKFKYTNL